MLLSAERRPRSLSLQPRPSLRGTGQVIAEEEQLRGRQRGLALGGGGGIALPCLLCPDPRCHCPLILRLWLFQLQPVWPCLGKRGQTCG